MNDTFPPPQEQVLSDDDQWTEVIRPVSGWFDLHLADLWRYRDLIMLFVRRDFVSVYKQTVLGPFWYLIQPILSTMIYTVIFGKVAKIPTDGVPAPLFYMAGITVWNYFNGCLIRTSSTFVGNAGIFGKVYFPRLAVPVSVIISGLISFGIQIALFFGYLLFYALRGAVVIPHPMMLLAIPLLVLQISLLGLGFGIIVSSLTTKYRDFSYLVGFGMQLWMYATPIVYPLSQVPKEWLWVTALNPMTPVVELFRYAFLGAGSIDPGQIVTSVVATAVILFVGIVLFSRVEKSFMDTV